MLTLTLTTAAALGQSGDGRADAAALRQRLGELNKQIDAERQAISEIERDRRVRSKALEGERARLAEQAADLVAERIALDAEVADLLEEATEAQAEARRLTLARVRLAGLARSLAERLSMYVVEIPGGDAVGGQLARAEDALADDRLAEGYVELMAAFDRLDRGGQAVTVRRTTLRTASGREQQVRLLSVGHVGFAYVVDGRVGLALAAPEDATGYRWREDLPASVRRRVIDFVEKVEAGTAGPAAAVMDVSGQLRAEAEITDQGLMDQLWSGGPVMWPLAALAVLAAMLLAERGWTLYVRDGADTSVAASVVRAVRAGKYSEAQDLLADRSTTLSRTLAAMLARRASGQHAMEDTVQERLLQEMPRLNRFFGGIANLAAVAPLLGLLGTVTGIIETFSVIRAVGHTSPDMMAGGISMALITTASGLVVAIPILLLHGMLRGRVDRIISETESHAAALLNILTHDRANGTSAPPPAQSEGDADD